MRGLEGGGGGWRVEVWVRRGRDAYEGLRAAAARRDPRGAAADDARPLAHTPSLTLSHPHQPPRDTHKHTPTHTPPPLTPTMRQTLYNAMLENNCSEHASRMSAMENSTKSAGDILNRLTLKYNRDRQANITTSLVEIISGAAALVDE